ncbi:phosphatidylserine/phosphatidylglycerophosphate/cardiolipin synthase family protein [Fodinicurvata sp. EGI_FJ10296]|uniref:phospholipase D-like domain-containing protein n=1 Tax=Fodinicurvata sp. EGI_FJ10296 TaxID=3231908 RepID=UPI00345635AE
MPDIPDPFVHRSHWSVPEPRWDLYQNNDSIWQAVFEQCDAAERSIELEQYIFETKGVGGRLLDLLAAKARKGVDVRILADAFGSHGLPRSDAGRRVCRAGGQIALYNGAGRFLRRPIRSARRLHRKTLICDRAQVMVGGSCYADRMTNWRDTVIRIDGPLPWAIASEFERAWLDAHDGVIDNAPPEIDEGASLEHRWSYAVSGPFVRSEPNLRETVPKKISGAQQSVYLTTPYLFPDRRLWRALTGAARRGVKVSILMPARSDHRVVDTIGHRFAHALQRRGVEVRGYTAGMLHAKVALIDGHWSSVSSFNLDLLSCRLNLESGVFSTSPQLYQALAARMDEDLASSQRL